jgi:hypothetical protein
VAGTLQKLAAFSMRLQQGSEAASLAGLLACLSNIQEVAQLLRNPVRKHHARFSGPDGLSAAASVIQAHWRQSLPIPSNLFQHLGLRMGRCGSGMGLLASPT